MAQEAPISMSKSCVFCLRFILLYWEVSEQVDQRMWHCLKVSLERYFVLIAVRRWSESNRNNRTTSTITITTLTHNDDDNDNSYDGDVDDEDDIDNINNNYIFFIITISINFQFNKKITHYR